MSTKKTKKGPAAAKSIKILMAAISVLSQFTANISIAAPQYGTHSTSPLFAKTKGTQVAVGKTVAAIKAAAGGSVNGKNAGAAFNAVIAANPGVSLNVVVAALNQLGLTGDSLSGAVAAISEGMGVSTTEVVSAIITNTYMNHGKGAADDRIADLRSTLGSELVDGALKDVTLSDNASNLSQIAPAAGGDDDAGGDTSLYNG